MYLKARTAGIDLDILVFSMCFLGKYFVPNIELSKTKSLAFWGFHWRRKNSK
jgi:hypothetical protein